MPERSNRRCMIDFIKISERRKRQKGEPDIIEIYPKFIVKKSSDLMIRGGDFYAGWIEERKMWSTDEQDMLNLIDHELDQYFKERDADHKYDGVTPIILHLWDADSGMIDKWHKYCQKQMRDNFHMLDETLIFSNQETKREDYASKRLSYPLEPGDCPAYEKLVSTLYLPEERHKIEWCIGSIVSGESKKLQKFAVLYGSAGSGKSTILTIIDKLFEGYCTSFEAKSLGSSSNAFALEAFKTNPLVSINHDGDLSRIDDNTRLNSLISHEKMIVNEKFKSTYEGQFKTFLFIGTNKPVKITDGKSGLLRRLIDISPSGKKLENREYNRAMKQIGFELGAIAWRCRDIYMEDPTYYDDYVPLTMLGASNDFYNYVADSYFVFKRENRTSLNAAWEMYKVYVEEAKVSFMYPMRAFKEELKNYFWDFYEKEEDGKLRYYYENFRDDKFQPMQRKTSEKADRGHLIDFKEQESIFDRECADCPAQYATAKETPKRAWEKVHTTLSELDTSRLHYVKVPENHIVIDFDIPGENGEKNYERNLEEASKFPATYAELSKSGAGVHLHYIYSGDVSKLSRIYDDHIEIKVFSGGSSLRRKLTKCNDLPIASIGSGLPLKGENKMVNFEAVKSEKTLRTMIKRNLEKEYHGYTTPSINFISKLLDDAYNSGMKYDVSDMRPAILAFAANSTHQADVCVKAVGNMKLQSEESAEPWKCEDSTLVFYDVEVFPNLFVVCYKAEGEGKSIVRMINPTPADIEDLLRYRLIGFNNRRYDNHILYAAWMGYSNMELFRLSQHIINAEKGSKNNYFFREAYNISYTDIYDFASAGNKKSLKKLEIEMGIHHQELGLPWDEPVPEALWKKVADYCCNDVVATEAAFHYLKGDWIARQILADLADMTVNDTTNTLSTKIIFGNNKNPQSEFNYRNLAEPVGSDQYEDYKRKFGSDYIFRVFDAEGLPLYRDYIPGETLPGGYSILPFFKGYTYERGVSTYLGEEIGEGGRVYAEWGMYGDVWDGDITGQHPSTIIAEMLFGPRYTKAFKEIFDGRVSIKHEAWSEIDGLFEGKLRPYIQKVIDGELTSKQLANALKTVVNSVYGLTKASFPNAFRDERNIDNIVAKRGALFMTLLKREVQKRGYKVAHIKTDSIKIPDADDSIKNFVTKFGKEFGYTFETEDVFEKFCLVNNAVFVAKRKDGTWTATGKQFQVPYVFKSLFSKEPIVFDDLCETFSSKTALYLDMDETLPDVRDAEKEFERLEDKYKKGKISDTTFEKESAELNQKIAKGHDYRFIGKVGQFSPVKPHKGGGRLVWEKDGKYHAPAGSSGYRWMESELLRADANRSCIDESYYRKLADEAVEAISEYGDFEWFVSDAPYITEKKSPDFMNIPEDAPEELPWEP